MVSIFQRQKIWAPFLLFPPLHKSRVLYGEFIFIIDIIVSFYELSNDQNGFEHDDVHNGCNITPKSMLNY